MRPSFGGGDIWDEADKANDDQWVRDQINASKGSLAEFLYKADMEAMGVSAEDYAHIPEARKFCYEHMADAAKYWLTDGWA